MLTSLEPAPIWKNFTALNSVPRPSKKEERVIAFIVQFGKQLGLPTHQDETGNVIIKKPASPGMENRPTVCLQSHLDMVHQKNGDTEFDFDKQGINMYVDGDWIKAHGTTLGADNGIGVASIMSILESKTISHPPLEALFTIDEETGMTGALNLKAGILDARYLFNLDTEDDRELTIGCAGGVDVTATGKYAFDTTPINGKALRITLKGLKGGHSGMDIHVGRGNANKLMNRLLLHASETTDFRIATIDGGSLRNAIPRESVVEIVIADKDATKLGDFITKQNLIFKSEHRTTDPDLTLSCEPTALPASVLNKTFQHQFLRGVYACPNGIYRMSPDIDRLVQTSNNLARVLVKDGAYTIQCLTRSSVDSEKMDLATAVRSCFELFGAAVSYAGSYPGWTPRPDSSIVKTMRELYKEMYKENPHVNACHAGLECGIIGTNYPDMQMISFGPNIRGAHSPDECVQVSSVQKYWSYLIKALTSIPS